MQIILITPTQMLNLTQTKNNKNINYTDIMLNQTNADNRFRARLWGTGAQDTDREDCILSPMNQHICGNHFALPCALSSLNSSPSVKAMTICNGGTSYGHHVSKPHGNS